MCEYVTCSCETGNKSEWLASDLESIYPICSTIQPTLNGRQVLLWLAFSCSDLYHYNSMSNEHCPWQIESRPINLGGYHWPDKFHVLLTCTKPLNQLNVVSSLFPVSPEQVTYRIHMNGIEYQPYYMDVRH